MFILQALHSSRRTGRNGDIISCSEKGVMITGVGNPQKMIHTLDPMSYIPGDSRSQEHALATPYFFCSDRNIEPFCGSILAVQ